MAEVVYARRALADLERLFEFLAETDPDAAAVAVETIQDAIGILERHPLIGRLVEHDLRELVISRGGTGYLALYDFVEAIDTVLILALRSQREAGYADDIGPM
jgi:plasmid stabilization system protein ParE